MRQRVAMIRQCARAQILDPSTIQRRHPHGPGVRQPLYLNGARQDGNYPLSIPVEGQVNRLGFDANAVNFVGV